MLSKIWNLFWSKRTAEGTLGKDWWFSKTIWVNVIALIVIIFRDQFGLAITGEESTYILGIINMILRFISHEPIGFKDQ